MSSPRPEVSSEFELTLHVGAATGKDLQARLAKEMRMRWSEIETVPCPVAQAMAVIGDSWTVLILRDCFRGASRFEEFLRRTRAPRAVLAERLAHLVKHGVLQRAAYAEHPLRYDYRLTAKGEALQPVMMTLAHWAETQLDAPMRTIRRRHKTCGRAFQPVIACSECGGRIEPGSVAYDDPPVAKADRGVTSAPSA